MAFTLCHTELGAEGSTHLMLHNGHRKEAPTDSWSSGAGVERRQEKIGTLAGRTTSYVDFKCLIPYFQTREVALKGIIDGNEATTHE